MIAVCTPTKDHVYAGTTYDLVQMMQREAGRALFAVSQGTILPNLRCEAARMTVKQNLSHLLFLDSDMRFPPDTLDKLLQRERPIVAVNCKDRQHNQWTARRNGRICSNGRTGVEAVNTVGCAVMLIAASVFKALPEPWFSTPWDEKTGKHTGEDVYFCNLARQHGFDIWIDHDLSQHVRHAATVEFGA